MLYCNYKRETKAVSPNDNLTTHVADRHILRMWRSFFILMNLMNETNKGNYQNTKLN